MKDLREAQDKEAEFTEKNVAARISSVISTFARRSPGTVHELSAHTVGGVIKPGDVIMEIVPDSDALEIEARLPPNEIDQVRARSNGILTPSRLNSAPPRQVEGVVPMCRPISRGMRNRT